MIAVARDYLAGDPSRGHLPVAFHARQWPASVVLAGCAGLAMVLLAAGPYPHERGPRLVVALLLCGTIAALRVPQSRTLLSRFRTVRPGFSYGQGVVRRRAFASPPAG